MIAMNVLAQFGIDALTVLFFIGLVGSALVVLLSFIEDLTELFGD
ncbi:MAG TPA: hypothetical protein VGT04_14225 [Acidobacteriaceae bacterium]|nr:hypothetical protein [Acidobacteriaceae bacterium]